MKIECSEIRFSRDGFNLRADAEFCEGLHVITGRIGSGKSTLASILAGTEKPDTGIVIKEGISSEILSMQFPEYHLTHMNLDPEIRSWGVDAETVLGIAGLICPEEKDPMTLSRGELKRLHLACLLQKKYDLMILDEPFSSLDCIWKRKFKDMMNEIDEGVRIIFTHEKRVLPEYTNLWTISDGLLLRVE
ncbi:MAG: ATP-binding cassette domain-containing protein [Methanomicrobiaceae archaeon]|nr:ATP-binding cassette domain-containing protein [Methanomicrobiaceae archaeon]